MRILPTVALAAIAAMMLTACSSSTPTPAPPPTTVPSLAPSTEPAVPLPTSVPVATGPTLSFPARETQAWYLAVKPDLDLVTSASAVMAATTQNADVNVKAIRLSCAQLATNIGRIKSDPVSPDDTVAADVASMVQNDSTASSDCLDGNVAKAITELSAGTGFLTKVGVRVLSLK